MTRPPTPPRRTVPDLYVTTRRTGALLRGPAARRALDVALGSDAGAWSPSGRGWVLPIEQLPDVLAYCQAHRLLVVISHDRPAAAPDRAPGGAA